MSRGWKHTDLHIEEDVTLPDELFIDSKKATPRILYSRYIGETDTGIMVEVQYEKGFCSEDPYSSWRVMKFIDFGKIYCGECKIYRSDRTLVKAQRKVQWAL